MQHGTPPAFREPCRAAGRPSPPLPAGPAARRTAVSHSTRTGSGPVRSRATWSSRQTSASTGEPWSSIEAARRRSATAVCPATWISSTASQEHAVEIKAGVEADVAGRDLDVVATSSSSPQPVRWTIARRNSHSAIVDSVKATELERVLDQDAAPEGLLRLVDVAADHGQRLVGEGQRQQVVQEHAAGDAPGDMLGDEARGEAVTRIRAGPGDAGGRAVGGAERQADAVAAQREVPADPLQRGERADRRPRDSSRCGCLDPA